MCMLCEVLWHVGPCVARERSQVAESVSSGFSGKLCVECGGHVMHVEPVCKFCGCVSNIQHWNDLTSDVVRKGCNIIPLWLKSLLTFCSILISQVTSSILFEHSL